MPKISQFKVVAALPATLEPDAVYYVRVGTGFDIYVTNSSGTVVAYPSNQVNPVTVTPEEAQAGTEPGLRSWSPVRIWQAVAAWWAASAMKAKLDGIESGAQVNAPAVSQIEAEAGAETGLRSWSPLRIRQSINALTSSENIVMNASFLVNQRNVSGTVVLSPGEYGHDRWKAGSAGCTYTFTRVGGVGTLNITSGSLVQVIGNGYQMAGTYVLSWGGTAQGRINGGSYSVSGITASLTAAAGIEIEFNTGTLTRVQFELGAFPTPFKLKMFSEELINCQRFYQAGIIEFSGSVVSGSTYSVRVPLKTQMRAAPTISLVSISGSSFPNSPGSIQSGDESIVESRVCNATSSSGGFSSTYKASADF
ncbi:hypothetical protein [Metapseudomonas otitidis]|uniref:hypothetical protein n=1 Tax=Metapseudomonas otitidis TaxID=319939 RepID=UPI00244B03BC|nr:hypothetical protein [Pseudomonas otitidis]MDH0334455.1 hypothetical protein [Pseudomonas otitidis]